MVADAPGVPDPHRELGLAYAGPLKNPKLARQHLQAYLRRVPRSDPDYQRVAAALDGLARSK